MTVKVPDYIVQPVIGAMAAAVVWLFSEIWEHEKKLIEQEQIQKEQGRSIEHLINGQENFIPKHVYEVDKLYQFEKVKNLLK